MRTVCSPDALKACLNVCLPVNILDTDSNTHLNRIVAEDGLLLIGIVVPYLYITLLDRFASDEKRPHDDVFQMVEQHAAQSLSGIFRNVDYVDAT